MTSDTANRDANLTRVLATLDPDIAASFTPEQTSALNAALAAQWQKQHALDFRPVVKIPLLPLSFYLVLLAGKNRREMSAREQRVAARTLISLIVGAILVLSVAGLAVLYLIKSALGIDLFPDYHLGLWFWFEDHVLKPLRGN